MRRVQSFFLAVVTMFFSVILLGPFVKADNGVTTSSSPLVTRADYIKERDRLARLPRFSFNNDGCDVFYYPATIPVTPSNLLNFRTTNLPKTGVTTLTYCTQSAGFGLFTHNTKKGELLSWSFDKNDSKRRNIAAELIANGSDVLQIMVDFCHANKLECFWSMRMNDTHDAASHPNAYHPLFPKLKREHPEWLVGSITTHTKYGPWSSVNYAIPEIRALAVSYVKEVCENYEVDGIELDFCRHLCYFKTVATGGTATDQEIQAMNELMKQMRSVTDQEGIRRGRPILLSVRVPDSTDYARAIGLDFEYWMKERLADIFIGSDYFHLNQWEYWVSLGHRYKVPVYACLSESRINDKDKRFSRNDESSYAARSIAAWDAGVNGIHIFNYYNATAPFLYSCGSVPSLKSIDKVFFQTTQYGGPRPKSYLKIGEQFRRLPVLSPMTPWKLKPNEMQTLDIDLGKEPERHSKCILLCCRLATSDEHRSLQLSVNGNPLANGQTNKKWPLWVDFPINSDQIHSGVNKVTFQAIGQEITLLDFAIHFSY